MGSFREYLLTEEFFEKIMFGDVSVVKTVGILTAENPGEDNKLTKIGNERKNKELVKDLEKRGFAPVQLKGRFNGMSENPLLVININKKTLVELGKKYRQQTVIFGQREKGEFVFSELKNGRAVRRGKLGVDHPENLLDKGCYLTISGKKYSIRFKSTAG